MEIIVTAHAAARYRERVFDYISSDETIARILKNVVQKGDQLSVKPSSRGLCVEIRYRGISVVAVQEQKRVTIITCLGDKTYRSWVKKNDNRIVHGRLLHPDSDDFSAMLLSAAAND